MDTKLKRLIVDEERFYINVLLGLLKDEYKPYATNSLEQAYAGLLIISQI